MLWLWIVAITVYLNVGYFWGLKRWHAWRINEPERYFSIWFKVSFPIAWLTKNIDGEYLIKDSGDFEGLYATIIALFWLIPAAWSALIWGMVGVYHSIQLLHKIFFAPANIVAKKM